MPTATADLVSLFVESDALRLAELVRQKEVTPAELTETAIHLIENLDPKLNAVVIRDFDRARARAAESLPDGPFGGVPYLLKNIGSGCEGLPLTNSLPFRRDYVSPSDSEMVRRIKASGLNILGRTNVPEQGWCIATEPRMYGPTLNPWNTAVTAGGSSGGAVSAVASRMIPMAEASDGGGIDTRACLMLRSCGAQAVARTDHLWTGRRRCLVRERVDIRGHPLGKGYGGVAGRDGCRHAGRPLYASEARAKLARLPSRASEAAQDRLRIDAAMGRAVRLRSDRCDEADIVRFFRTSAMSSKSMRWSRISRRRGATIIR